MENTQKNTQQEVLQSTIKIFLIFSMAIFMLLPTISASDDLGTFAQNSNIRITQTCSDATYITINSISVASNSTPKVLNAPMINVGGGEFYYMFNITEQVGKYDIREISDGCEKSIVNYLSITPSGNATSQSQGLLSIGIIGSIVLIMIFFGWLSFKFIENDKTFAIGLFFLVMSLILSLYTLFLGYIFSRDYLFMSISNVQEKIFLSGLFGLLGIMFIGFTLLIVAVIKEVLIKRTEKKYGEGYNQKTKTYD